ncbi:MAG: DNA-processing protein DprA [Thermodesulfobacteriota bacterium]
MDNDISPWLVLKSVNGIGNILYKRLINRFNTPLQIFNASVKDLAQTEGMTLKKAENIKRAKETDFVKQEIKTAQFENIKIVHLNHKDYPQLLKEISDPPPVLYIKGEHPSDIVSIAVVGSRNAGNEGRAKASVLSSALSEKGIRVTSGMALGIDGAAHSAALKQTGGTTAVLGSGLLNIYPREHRTLFKKITENGAAVSEFALHSKPDAHNFPARNRIISGLSIGVIVIEAGEKSGALITAELAADQGKDVFTADLKQTNSPGTIKLNELGAKKINTCQDLLNEYPWTGFSNNKVDNNKKTLDFNETLVVKALKKSQTPLHIDELCRDCGINYSNSMGAVILNLELKGIIEQLPGKFYYLIKDEN